jgi:rod shape-determining protein MreD
MIFRRRRRERPRASHRQAALVPRRLSFRRRRAPTPPPPRAAQTLSFRHKRAKPVKPARTAGAQQLRFRSKRPKRATAPSDGMPRRLSFRRRRPGARSEPAERSPRRLSFRRGERAQSGAGLLRRLMFWRGSASASADAPRPERARAADPLRLTARLVAIGFAASMLQLLVLSQIGVLGVTVELAPLVVAATGFLCGSLTGACFGFAVGLFIDLAFVQVLGISSLLFTVIGYGAGRLREQRAPDAPMTRLGLGAAATALSLGGYGAIEFMLGVNLPVSSGLVGAIVKTTLLNSLIALPVYALMRRALLGALPASERAINRAATTKRMSPLTRA